MINIVKDKIIGAYTNGFDITTDGLSITFGEGSITFTHDKNKNGVLEEVEIERYRFESFTLDIEPDDELYVLYDFYLCADGFVDIMRFEMTPDTIPHYIGESEILHCICNFVIEPKAQSLDNTNVNVRLLELVVEGEEHGIQNN